MIKLRFSSLEENKSDKQFDIAENEKLDAAVTRVLEGIDLGKFKAGEVFDAVVNGHAIPPDLWSLTLLKPEDSVLIAPSVKSGESGQIFKQVAILAVAIVASVFLSPAVGGGILGALAATAATVGASLLLNALIPPPVPEVGGIPGLGTSFSSSQMYAITGQSNSVKKFGSVPKVYGTHRVFPNVAANPYTELETDPETGQLVQYLYAVYDFGFGPMDVGDIRIGDTSFGDFADAQFALVDFNKPAVNEGFWDESLQNKLTYYKGDSESDTVAVGLDKNQNEGGPVDTYQAVRNSAENTDGVRQTIALNFVNPTGLYGYNAGGEIGVREITLDISFAPVGTNDWHGYNDLNYVENFSSAGGAQATFDFATVLYPGTPEPLGGNPYFLLSQAAALYGDAERYNLPTFYRGANLRNSSAVIRKVGYPAGASSIVVLADDRLIPNAPITYQGRVVSYIYSVTPHSNPNYVVLTLQYGLTEALPFFEYIGYINLRTENGVALPNYWSAINESVHNRLTTHTTSYGKARISRAETSPTYSTFKFTPKNPGQYKVRVTREYTTGPYTTQIQDKLTWGAIVTRFDRNPIVTDKRHVFLELRIRATNQLNGAIQNLSATCTSILDVYDGTTWTKQVSRNPAWVFADLLTGEVNKRPVDKSRLHLPSIMEWAEYCDEIPDSPPDREYQFPRFEANFVLDYAATLQTVINQVCSASQASLNIIDGKYGVLIDRLKTTPIQVFTPRNSRDFSSSRNYSPRPDGLSVKYIDPSLSWSVAEIVAFDNGFTAENALNIEEISSFACTNPEQAWRFGRYMIAQNRLRQETMSILVDFEHLVCTRGDYVQVTQDVMRVGGSPARVKSVSGNRVVIDDGLEIVGGIDYGYVFRSITGEIKTSTLTPVFADTFDLDGDMPAVGDLIIIGEVGSIVYDCIVKSITPNDDLSANLILVEKADAIYEYESTELFAPYDPQLSATTDPDIAPPNEVEELIVADYGWECSGNDYKYFVVLDWNAPLGSTYETFQIFVDDGRGFNQVASTRDSLYTYEVEESRLGIEHKFKVLAVSATGKKLDLGAVDQVTNTPVSKTTAPSDVDSLSTDITGEVLQLVWPQIPDCDCREYLIRFSPLTDGASWEASIPLLRLDRNATLASTQARTGTYLIKAIDWNGNESANAALAITTIPQLFNLNVIDEITDAPDWNGTLDKVEIVGDTLVLDTKVIGGIDTAEYYSEGFYYYESLLDLGEIYTVRLQSLIQAEGYTAIDIMSNWVTLDSVLLLATARYSEWDVETQYRSTEALNVMAEWVTLEDVELLNSGVEEQFTEWRKFIMGDATGRVFQFRLRLVSNKPTVSPRVFDGTIKADMPDRIESYNNLVATAVDGYELTYSPAFAGPGTTPNVQISIDDAESGDYWQFDEKTLNGFVIRFYDKNDNPVERQFDVVAKGYGRKAASVI